MSPGLSGHSPAAADFGTTATLMKDARYFKHDANARHDPKIKALLNKYKLEGYGRFWVLIEMLREASHYRLEDKPYMWDTLAEEFKCTPAEAREFIKDCTETYNLFEQDNGYYYSTSLLTRMVQLDQMRENKSHAANVRWQAERLQGS